MARQRRFSLSNQTYYIMQKANCYRHVFLYEKDYSYFLQKLFYACSKYKCALHAYSLEPESYHILVTPQNGKNISKMMQFLSKSYTLYYNEMYDSTGSVWWGRYKSTILNPAEYFLVCSQYIESMPVDLGLVKKAEDYIWSSFKINAGIEHNGLLTEHEVYLGLGKNCIERQRSYYELFVNPIRSSICEEISDSVNGSWVLGNKNFCKKIELLSERRTSPKPRGGDRKSVSYLEKLTAKSA